MQAARTLGCAVLWAALGSGCSASSEPVFDVPHDTGHDADATEGLDAPDLRDTFDVIDVVESVDHASDDGPRDTIGMICSADEDCQNGTWCDGEERCPYGFCTAGARVDCDDSVNCTLDTCNESTASCEHEVDDLACDDSDPCTVDGCEVTTDTCTHDPIDCGDGVTCTLDTCDSTTGDCGHAVSDLACDDSDACTIDTCDETADRCTNELIDGDSDTYPPESCGGDDCDDGNASIHPGAVEICGDGTDQDCDGTDGAVGTCSCPTVITGDGTYTGTTSGTTSHSGTCGGSGPEDVFRIDMTGTGWVVLETYGSLFDTVLYVRRSPCTSGTEEGCDDDGGLGVDSYLRIRLSAGTTYYVFVDGFGSGSGSYTLTVTGL